MNFQKNYQTRAARQNQTDIATALYTRAAVKFPELFGMAPAVLRVDPSGCWIYVEADNLLFRGHLYANTITFHLLNPCPVCGKVVMSRSITCLSELEELLREFVPSQNHICSVKRRRRRR